MAKRGNSRGRAQGSLSRMGLALFVGSSLLFALTSSPAIGWFDSPEFVAQGISLGNAHSPGHPLPALLAKLATFVPVGDLVWRINLMNGLCAAASVALLGLLLRRLIAMSASRMSHRSATLMASGMAAVAALSWALWSSALRAEVYALQGLLSVAVIYSLVLYDERSDRRFLWAACLSAGLGLANHHLLMLVLMVPGAAFVFLRRECPGLRLSLSSAAMGMLGLTALLYLPVRSLAHPLVNFGAPHSLERFYWTLSGAAFGKAAGEEHVSTPIEDSIQCLVAIAEGLSLPLLLIALAAPFLLRGEAAARRITIYLAATATLTVAVRVFFGFDPGTPDHHAYLLPALLSMVALAAMGLARLCQLALLAPRPLPKAPVIAATAIFLLLPIRLGSSLDETSLHNAWASDDLAHWELEALPPRSLVLSAYFETRFRTWSLQAVEGARPDLRILDRSFLTYPGMADEAKHRHPELSELIDAPVHANAPPPIEMLTELAQEAPVLVQLHPNVDRVLGAALLPAGPYAAFVPEDREEWAKILVPLDAREAARLGEDLSRAGAAESEHAAGALLWSEYLRSEQYCRQGLLREARESYARAIALAPDDALLRELGSRCALD